MANRAYLLNTQFAISDPQLLQKKLSEPGNDYAEVAEAAYKIPIPWLCCFRQADLQTFPYRLGDDDDGNVIGSADTHPIHPGPGAHVANAGFVVHPARRGEGVGSGQRRPGR